MSENTYTVTQIDPNGNGTEKRWTERTLARSLGKEIGEIPDEGTGRDMYQAAHGQPGWMLSWSKL